MKKQITGFALLIASGLAIGCGGKDNPLGDGFGGLCPGLQCKTIAEAGGSITGVAKFDAFFTSVVNFNAQANVLEADVRAALGELAAAAGVQVEAGATIDDLSAAIVAKVEGNFDGNIDGGLTLEYEPPRCEVSAQASIQAAAKCDAMVDPGSVSVECEGTCEAEASAMLECSGSATLECTGTAPSFACEGTCKGSCEIQAGAECTGECKGTCEVDAAADCDGEFTAGTGQGANGSGTCKVRSGGTCSGTCKGSCELTAGGTCDGECKGECTYTAPSGGCTGGAKASCKGTADAKVECTGTCKGEATPPMVEAACQASVKAEADLKAECHPPSIDVAFNLSADFAANGSATAQADFAARMEAFGKAYAKLVATAAKLDLVAHAGTELVGSASGAITTGLRGVLDGEASLSAKFQATCLITDGGLAEATGMINSALGKVEGSVTAVGSVTTAVGG
jgi:hypothetical protein